MYNKDVYLWNICNCDPGDHPNIRPHSRRHLVYVTGPAKTGHICTNYTCPENGTFLGLYLRYSYSVNFINFFIDL